MILYHLTSALHYPKIDNENNRPHALYSRDSGRLKLVESNISEKRAHAGPDVVWLTTNPSRKQGWQDGAGVDKGRILMTLDLPDEWKDQYLFWWPAWARAHHMAEYWYAALAASGGNPDEWWVCTCEITSQHWKEVLDQDTGTVLFPRPADHGEHVRRMKELDATALPHFLPSAALTIDGKPLRLNPGKLVLRARNVGIPLNLAIQSPAMAASIILSRGAPDVFQPPNMSNIETAKGWGTKVEVKYVQGVSGPEAVQAAREVLGDLLEPEPVPRKDRLDYRSPQAWELLLAELAEARNALRDRLTEVLRDPELSKSTPLKVYARLQHRTLEEVRFMLQDSLRQAHLVERDIGPEQLKSSRRRAVQAGVEKKVIAAIDHCVGQLRVALNEQRRWVSWLLGLESGSPVPTVSGGSGSPRAPQHEPVDLTYSIAVEHQASTLVHLSETQDARWSDERLTDIVIHDLRNSLRRAESFYWGRNTLRLVAQAAPTFPDDHVLTLTDLPVSNGFFYLSTPFIQPGHHREARLTAMSFRPVSARGTVGAALESFKGAIGIEIAFYHIGHNPSYSLPFAFGRWYFGDAIGPTIQSMEEEYQLQSDLLPAADPKEEFPRISEFSGICMRLFGAMLTFINSRYMTTVRQRADRPTRRRLGWTAPPDLEPQVQVVVLRRLAVRHEKHGDSEPVDWSCQWVVHAHWHRYHAKGDNGEDVVKRVWVGDYLKGPADKPLKEVDRVWAAVR